jgi:hypothetical protein
MPMALALLAALLLLAPQSALGHPDLSCSQCLMVSRLLESNLDKVEAATVSSSSSSAHSW